MQRVPTTGDKVLKYLTSETAGIAMFPSRVEEFPQSFQSIDQQLHRPEPLYADGKFHSLEIRPKSKRLTVRARQGYFAPTALRPSGSSGKDR